MQKRPKVAFAFKTQSGNYLVSRIFDVVEMNFDTTKSEERIDRMLYMLSCSGGSAADFMEAIKSIETNYYNNNEPFIGCAANLAELVGCKVYIFGTDIPIYKRYIEVLQDCDSLLAYVKRELRTSYEDVGCAEASFYLDDGSSIRVANVKRHLSKKEWEYTIEKSGGTTPKNVILTKDLYDGLSHIITSKSNPNGVFYFGV